MAQPEILTQRLCLRRWKSGDRAPFARMNRDSRVTEFLAHPITGAESDALADRIEAHFETHGFGLWAVEVPGVVSFAGFIGLSIPRYETPFMPCVEVGWRLDPEQWGRGYATEGAREAVRYGFEQVGLTEIVSFTTESNIRSRRVMEKIGMERDPDGDFNHPLLSANHPLLHHVLYRLSRNHAVGS